MPAGLGGFDAQGVWQFGEADAEVLMSDLLNKGMQSVSDQFVQDRLRLAELDWSTAPITPRAGWSVNVATSLRKQGDLVTLQATFTKASGTLANDTHMVDLPVGFRPAVRTRGGALLFGSGDVGGFDIREDGEVRVYNRVGATAISLVAFTVSYVAAG